LASFITIVAMTPILGLPFSYSEAHQLLLGLHHFLKPLYANWRGYLNSLSQDSLLKADTIVVVPIAKLQQWAVNILLSATIATSWARIFLAD